MAPRHDCAGGCNLHFSAAIVACESFRVNPMSVEKSKPFKPRMLEDVDARRIERLERLMEETKKTVARTQELIRQAQKIIKQSKEIY